MTETPLSLLISRKCKTIYAFPDLFEQRFYTCISKMWAVNFETLFLVNNNHYEVESSWKPHLIINIVNKNFIDKDLFFLKKNILKN